MTRPRVAFFRFAAASMAPLRLNQIGLVLFDADLIDAFDRAPESAEFVNLMRVAGHLHHLHHDLKLRPTLMLHAREANEVIAYLFEPRALAIVLEGLFRRAVETQSDMRERRRQQFFRGLLVEKSSVGGKQRGDAV